MNRVAADHRRHVGAAEQDRRRPQADAHVVVAVDHRVLGVVGHHPEQVGGEQPPADHRHLAAQCGEGHRDAEGKGDRQPGLRQRKEALEQRIAERHRGAGDRQPEGQRVQRDEQQRRGGDEQQADRPRLRRRHLAAGDHAVGGPLDVAVEVAVEDVVDRAARRAHEQRAEAEDRQVQSARRAFGSDPQRRQRRPQQQQRPDRLVEADQAGIQCEAVKA